MDLSFLKETKIAVRCKTKKAWLTKYKSLPIVWAIINWNKTKNLIFHKIETLNTEKPYNEIPIKL